jgi:DNA-binding MarR family transcriptional regulator
MATTTRQVEKVPALETHLGFWLRRVSNAVSGAFARSLQEKQTSVAEWVLLRELHARGQAAPGELAAALGLTRGAVSKIVDKLEAKRWVQAAASHDDGRFRQLSPTRAGRHNLPVLAQLADQNEARFFECLSAKERDLLRTLLIKLAQHNQINDVPTE